MKNMICKILSLMMATFLCVFTAPALASGLFDGVLPSVAGKAVEDSYTIPDPVAAFLGGSSEEVAITRHNGKIRLSCAIHQDVLDEASTDFAGLKHIAYDFEELSLTLNYYSEDSDRYPLTKEDVEETFAEELQAKISKVAFDFENAVFLLEYPEAAYATSTPATSVAPIQANHTFANDLCGVCGGLGMCNHCVGGDCNYCFGQGDEYCTGGCIGGRCIACDDGKTLVGFDINDNPKYRNCSYCRGGVCKTCGGDGYVACTFCHGTGNCNFCYGSGECNYCN